MVNEINLTQTAKMLANKYIAFIVSALASYQSTNKRETMNSIFYLVSKSISVDILSV